MAEIMNDKIALRLRIYGKVQGVGYRNWLLGEAQARGLYGFVRNRVDGTVEALLIGPPDSVEACVSACHDGPNFAEVTKIDQQPARGLAPHYFEIKPTV